MPHQLQVHFPSKWRLKLKDWPLQNVTWHLRLTVNHKMCLDAERNQNPLNSQAMAPHQATCCWVHSSAGFIQKNERWRAHQGDRERQLSLAPVSQSPKKSSFENIENTEADSKVELKDPNDHESQFQED